MLRDHSIIMRKCIPGWRGCKTACKGRLFLPHLSRLPHLPGVPHLYVNRPSVSGTVKLVINGIPNPGLAVILLPSSKTSAYQPKEPLHRCNTNIRLRWFHASRFVTFFVFVFITIPKFQSCSNTPTNKIFRKAL